MRKLFVPAVLALVASSVYAQDELPEGVTQEKIEWDGTAEFYWKVINPNGAGDAFSVDIDNKYHDCNIVGIGLQTLNTGALAAPSAGGLAIAKDNLAVDPTGQTPDKSNVLTQILLPQSADPGVDRDCIDVPDVCIPSSCNAHVVYIGLPGDSQVWLGSDTNGSQFGNSYFTTDCYGTPAIPFTVNWVLGLDSIPKKTGSDAIAWVNGGTSATIAEQGSICFLFVGCCGFQPYMLFLSACGGSIITPAVNIVLFTGIGQVDDAGNTGSICSTWPCDVVPGGTMLCFRMVYRDCPPSKKIKISNEVKVTISDNPACGACCFGQADDGVLDANIWKVQNPAGSNDWFNVEHGAAPSCVKTLTSVDVASWNFCAVASPWDEVGIYDSNLTLDPTGGTPKLPALSAVNGQSVPAGQSDWSYPATNYNGADVVKSASANYHAGAKWANGDSCIWLGSDTDGIDPNVCGANITTSSYFTIDGYATPAVSFSGAAWMMKINFQ